ncbi:MAG: single-stranded-DNA-specific exonuclease RecJ [Rhodobiaceae bacterium]|nr:single-stranded-DNA-specific exonuclease RecJ [Rhodobiaceae bacterium]MCC0047847.1 single-stranded-DNA-specific exonuclease RecJ [Rhodobiaceae bacterium]
MNGPAAGVPFLDVSRSATGRRWVDRLPEGSLRLVRGVAEQLELPEIVARILLARGVDPDEAGLFLEPKLRELMPDPRTLTDAESAASRIADAVEANERIGIFGDYDVDGATSSALLGRFLMALGVKADIHIPDRIFEGYGPNEAAFERFRSQGCTLVVTVDCGTASHDTIAGARAKGLDVVVIDHHQTGETLPQANALVNPNRQDDISGQGHLAAVGVVFLVLVETLRQLRERGRDDLPNLLQWLDLVALGTVADVVPLTGLNRAYVSQGLKIMRRRDNAGLRALSDVARLRDAPTPYHLGFLIGPRINAGGRIGDAALGARLLTCDDPEQAAAMAAQLDRLNSERQALEQEALAQAMSEAEAADATGAPVIVVASDDWHPGIVGLIASRLKERFRKPAIAVSFASGAQGSGSARSVAGVDIGAAVRAAVDEGLLVKGGGHAMAAGMTVERGRLDAFREAVGASLMEAVAVASLRDELRIDGAITAAAAGKDLVHNIERAGPFGAGHPEPVLALPAHRLTYCEATEQGHFRLGLAGPDSTKIQGIAFRAADTPLGAFLSEKRGQNIHAAGALRLNRWGGSETVQLQLRDAADPAKG